MDNIQALQAIEQGEKPDQETLLRLKDEGLVDLADVTNMDSVGQEFIFVGFTAEGLRLMKESKLPLLSDLEKDIARAAVRVFLDQHRAISQRALLKQFKSPITSALQRLGNQSVLQVVNNTYLSETYLPKASAFFHCGDPAALAFARKSTEIVLRVLPVLFDRDLDGDAKNQKRFTRDEVEHEARAIDSSVEPDMTFTGLYLAQEFSVFTAIQHDDQQVGIVTFSLSERVYDTAKLDWDRHIRQLNVSLVHDRDKTERQSLPIAIPSLPELLNAEFDDSQADNQLGRKVFLVHGHAEETKQNVASFLRSLDLDIVILHEKANQGLTIIEKFERHSDVRFAVVLLTPDDSGASVQHPEKTRHRARQNVILELGYFLAKLGRNKVCCLYVDGIELPSDYDGVLYVPYDQAGAWRSKLMTELSAAGISLDSEKSSATGANRKTIAASYDDVTMVARKGGPVRFPR